MVTFTDVIAGLEKAGFYEVALPFILIFTIVFAVLQKINLFGDKKFNAVFALVMAFLVVRTQAVVEIMNQFLPKISLIALVLIVILLLLGITLGPRQIAGFQGWFGGFAIILVLLGVGLAFFSSSEDFGITLPSWLVDFVGEDWRLILGIGVFMWFISWITSDPQQGTSFWAKAKGALQELESGIRGGGK